MSKINSTIIKQLANEVGFDVCGITRPQMLNQAEWRIDEWVKQGKHGSMTYLEDFSHRAKQFWSEFPEAKSVIVLGLNYYSSSTTDSVAEQTLSLNLSQPEQEPVGRVARYAWGRDYHHVIKEKLTVLQKKISAHSTQPVRFHSAVDTKPLAERDLAEKAGLGFIGKQTQLLSLQYGPWLFLAELVTDLDLEEDVAFEGSCGTCRLCIDTCPTHAIEENQGIDARQCIAYLTIENKDEIPPALREKMDNWVFGCDECLNICPFAHSQQQTTCKELTASAGFGSHLDLAALFDIPSQAAYERKFQGTALLRTRHKHLLRNACVVLGNSNDPAAIPILRKAMRHAAALVREHAVWALEKLGAKPS